MLEVKESNKIIFNQNDQKRSMGSIRIDHKIDFSAWNQLLLLLIIMCFLGYWNCGVDVINYHSHLDKSPEFILFSIAWSDKVSYFPPGQDAKPIAGFPKKLGWKTATTSNCWTFKRNRPICGNFCLDCPTFLHFCIICRLYIVRVTYNHFSQGL